MVAQATAVEPANGGDPVPRPPPGDAVDAPAGGDARQRLAGPLASRLPELRRKEVGEADLHPVGASPRTHGDAKGIPVADMHHGPGEPLSAGEAGGKGALLGDGVAGVGPGRDREDEEPCGDQAKRKRSTIHQP